MQKNDFIDWSEAIPQKISVRIDGHSTSVSLEKPFLNILKRIAHQKGQSLASVITDIDNKRPQEVNLSASLRVFVLNNVINHKL